MEWVAAGTWEPYTFELGRIFSAQAAHSSMSTLMWDALLYAASLGATVYAVEADVDNFALLLENVRVNPERDRASRRTLCAWRTRCGSASCRSRLARR